MDNSLELYDKVVSLSHELIHHQQLLDCEKNNKDMSVMAYDYTNEIAPIATAFCATEFFKSQSMDAHRTKNSFCANINYCQDYFIDQSDQKNEPELGKLTHYFGTMTAPFLCDSVCAGDIKLKHLFGVNRSNCVQIFKKLGATPDRILSSAKDYILTNDLMI